MTRALPLLLAGLFAASSAAAQPWPTARHDAGRSGRSGPLPTLTTPAEAFAFAVGGSLGPDELLVQDVDLDGLPETVFPSGGRVLALRDGGDLLWASDDIDAWWMLGTADLNGDGRPEIAVATAAPGIALLDGLRGLTLFASPAGDVSSLGTILPLDVEGDGTVELYVADDGCSHDGRGSGRIYALTGGGVPTSIPLRTETHDVWCGRDHAVADLDGDGRPEIVAPDEDRVWAYDPTLGFSTHASGSLGAFPWGLVHTAVADLDGDGDDELILASDNPWRWYTSARRLQVLDAEGDELVSRWIVRSNPEAGGHRFLAAPAADVLSSSPGLEVVSSIADSASSGWEVRIFRGLPDDGNAELLATIPGAVALGLADLDGDGLAEILARPAPGYVIDPGPSTIAAYDVGEDGTAEELWSLPQAGLPLAPDPRIHVSALPPAGRDGWGGPARPIVYGGPAGLPSVIVGLHDDGGDLPAGLALLDGPTGTELGRWSGAESTPGAGGLVAVVRASGAHVRVAAATEQARVAHLGSALTLADDADTDGVPDVVAANRAPGTPIVPSDTAVVVTSSAGRVLRLAASCTAPACPPVELSLSRLSAGEPRVSAAACDCTVEPLLAGASRTVGGNAAVALLRGVADPAATTIDLGRSLVPVADALPVGPLDAAFPAWDAVALALYDSASNRSSLALVSTGGERTLWVGLDSDGRTDGSLAAADLDDDGRNEIVAVRSGFVQVVSADGEEVVRHDTRGGGSVLAWDVGDGRPALFRTGADSFAVERLDTSLDRVWIAGEGISHRGRAASIVGIGDGSWRVVAVAEASAELVAYDASDGSTSWRVALAQGRAHPDTAAAYAAGDRPGVLSSPASAAGSSASVADTVVVGSTDGFLYGVSATDGSLAWSVPLHAAVGEPVVAALADPGSGAEAWTAVLAPTADGLVRVIGEATLPAPREVWDGDGVTEPASATDDIDESHDGAVVAAAWPAVPEAEAYVVQVTTAGDVVVRPWWRTTEPRFAVRDTALRPGERYRTLVRAVSGTRFSQEAASDGFAVRDTDAPWVEVSARPGRILPDVDGVDDTSTIGAALSDSVLLVRWRADVRDEADVAVRSLGRGETGRSRVDLSLAWDGRDDDGRVVAGGPWQVVVVAEDSTGHEGRGETVVWVCAGEATAAPECAEIGGDAGAVDGGSDAAPDAADAAETPPVGGGGCACRVGAPATRGIDAVVLLAAGLCAWRSARRRRSPRAPLSAALVAVVAALLSCSAPPPPGTVPPPDPLAHARRDAAATTAADAGAEPAAEAGESPADAEVAEPAPAVDAGVTPPEATGAPETAAPADAGAPAPSDVAAATEAAPANPRPPVPPPSGNPSTVLLRLGCSTVTEGQLERSVRLVRVFAGLAGQLLPEEDEARLREVALERLGLEVIVRREAEARGLTVSAAEIQAAAAMVAQGNGVEVAALFLQVEDQGLSNAEYEQDLEFQILEMKVIQAYAVEVPVVVTDAEIEAEYLARTEGLDPSTVRPLADVREVLREALAADKVEIQGRAWLIRRRDELGRTRAVRGSGGACVEQQVAAP